MFEGFGLAILDGGSGGSGGGSTGWIGGSGTVVLSTSPTIGAGTVSTYSAPTYSAPSYSAPAYSAPAPAYSAPASYSVDTAGPFGEGDYTPLDYPAMKFQDGGLSLRDEVMASKGAQATTLQWLALGIALLALLKR